MRRPNEKLRVIDHYNRVSPYYRKLWGEHLHHGYWIRGDESKETAQVQLVEHLADAAAIPFHAVVLDVGCGLGGSSVHLARERKARVTGITISPLQVEMAREAADRAGIAVSFLCMDAEAMSFDRLFDVVWSIESISHYQDVPHFFASAAKLLQPGGVIAITDWFMRRCAPAPEHQRLFGPIEDGMLVELHTMQDYQGYLAAVGMEVIRTEVLNEYCAKTWDFCLEIIKERSLWNLAASNGPEFVRFLRAFKAMRAGFSSGDFVYGLMVARKSDQVRADLTPGHPVSR